MADKPLDVWKKKLAGYQALAAKITVDAAGKADIPEDTRKAFKELNDLKDDTNFQVFVGGQIDLDAGLHLARAGILAWWLLHTGRAFVGDVDGLRRVSDENKKSGNGPFSTTTALTWVCYDYTLVEGFSNKITVDVLQQLVDWGADVNNDNGMWLERSLRGLNRHGLAPLINGGASGATVARVLDELQNENNFTQAKEVRAAVMGKTLDGKVDDQTLLRATFSPDGAVLKTYFNFATRRVQEVHVLAKDSTMDACDFRDYDAGVIGAAQKALVKSGGKPTPYRHAGNFGIG